MRTALDLNPTAHEEQARLYADFLARGGVPERCPHGQMAHNAKELPSTPGRAAATPIARKVAAPPAAAPAPAEVAPAHRIPNAETFPRAPVAPKPKRGQGKATRLAAIAEAAAAKAKPTTGAEYDPARDPSLSAWKRIQAAFRAGGNRMLYTGELRLLTGIDGRNVISTALQEHLSELERVGARPYCQYRLRNP